MPGFAGIISTISQEENGAVLDEMVKCMMHERFYTLGTYVNEKLGLHKGWRNIIPISVWNTILSLMSKFKKAIKEN